MLGRFYAESEEELRQAFSRIQRAATNHHREATKTLALMLKEGEGCLLDLDDSVEWPFLMMTAMINRLTFFSLI